jgi:hypothetical protein
MQKKEAANVIKGTHSKAGGGTVAQCQLSGQSLLDSGL